MSNVTRNNAAFIAKMRALLAGMANALPAGATQVIAGGKVSTMADVTAEVEGFITVFQAAEDTAVAFHTAVQTREDMAPAAVARYNQLQAAFKSMLGKKSPNLVKVGMEPDKTPAPPPVEKKQASVAKGKATRVARGTKGKKQLAAIHGEAPPATPQAAPKEGQ